MAKQFYSPGMLLGVLALSVVSHASRAAAAPTVSISASPDDVTVGERSRLTWASTHATKCVGSGSWTGVQPLKESKDTGHLTKTVTFTLACTGTGGTARKSVTVKVTGGSTAAPTVTISANPRTVTQGSTTVINWSSSNAKACTGTGAWTGSEGLSGTRSTGALTTDVTFALTCTGAGGSASQSTTVSVTAAPVSGDATLSWSAPTTNTNGTPVSALTGYHLYYGSSASELTKSIAISGAATDKYEITGLTAGTWYFAVAADASDGTESAKSAVGSKTI
jgi:hypothetical protein